MTAMFMSIVLLTISGAIIAFRNVRNVTKMNNRRKHREISKDKSEKGGNAHIHYVVIATILLVIAAMLYAIYEFAFVDASHNIRVDLVVLYPLFLLSAVVYCINLVLLVPSSNEAET